MQRQPLHVLPALEVKRRGVIALEEALKQGPVHIIKNNRPACVVLSEADYARLAGIPTPPTVNLWDLLQSRPWHGKRKKKDIDRATRAERNSWKK